VAINNHKPHAKLGNNTNLEKTKANRKIPLFRGSAASSHGNRRQFVEIS
jgi:hypothetical protein